MFFKGLTKAMINITGNINPNTKAILNSVKEKEAACAVLENKNKLNTTIKKPVNEKRVERKCFI
jgi:hypothetical protein